MPEDVEQRLRREAQRRWPNDPARQDRYVYGTLRDLGWKPGKEAPPAKPPKKPAKP